MPVDLFSCLFGGYFMRSIIQPRSATSSVAKTWLAGIGLGSVLFATSATAQESAEEAAPESEVVSPAAALRSALSAVAGADNVVFDCSIQEVEPEADGGFGGGIVMRIGGAGGGGGGATFEGTVDVWQAAGERILTSRDVLPGISIYTDGDRLISRTTVEEAAIDLGKLHSDLLPLLDLAKVAKRLDRVSLEVSTDEASGDTIYEGELPKRLVHSSGSDMPMMQEVVLRLEGVFRVGSDGALKSAKFAVIRNDPMAAIRRQAMSGELGSGGSVRVERSFGGADAAEVSQDEGTMSVYEITIAGTPSARAKRFKEEVHEILSTEEF